MKECSCLESFKSKIRKWKPDCSCRQCNTYLQHVGFLFKCAYTYTSIQIHILSLYDNSNYFSFSRHFIHTNDSVLMTLQYLHNILLAFEVTISDTEYVCIYVYICVYVYVCICMYIFVVDVN